MITLTQLLIFVAGTFFGIVLTLFIGYLAERFAPQTNRLSDEDVARIATAFLTRQQQQKKEDHQ